MYACAVPTVPLGLVSRVECKVQPGLVSCIQLAQEAPLLLHVCISCFGTPPSPPLLVCLVILCSCWCNATSCLATSNRLYSSGIVEVHICLFACVYVCVPTDMNSSVVDSKCDATVDMILLLS